jgi:Family of unknown function (DUF6247)
MLSVAQPRVSAVEVTWMGSTSLEPITRPAGLHDDLPYKLEQITNWATDVQRREFMAQLSNVINRVRADNDLRPFHLLIEAWWQSLLLQQDHRHEAAVHEATTQRCEPMPIDEFLAELDRR